MIWERVPAVSAGLMQMKAPLRQPRHVRKHPLHRASPIAGATANHPSDLSGSPPFLLLDTPQPGRSLPLRMWDPISYGTMPDFWAPRPGRFWDVTLTPVRRLFLRKVYSVGEVELLGVGELDVVRRGDGVLLAPNHSHDSDPHVMIEVGRLLRRRFFFIAAWQLFKGHKGIDGWVMHANR